MNPTSYSYEEEQELDNPTPLRKLPYVINYNKSLKRISITYPSRSNRNVKHTMTISSHLDDATCTCKTYTVNGECYHITSGLTLLEAAFEFLNSDAI